MAAQVQEVDGTKPQEAPAPPAQAEERARQEAAAANLEFFAASLFSTNLDLGQAADWDGSEREACRAHALRLGLMHNIPSESNLKRMRPRHSLTRNTYVWKPQPNEKAILGLLQHLLQDPVHELLTFAADFNAQERFVAHLAADMLDLEHQSIDTPAGRMLCVWKRSLNRPLPEWLRDGLDRELVKHERGERSGEGGEDKEGQNIGRVRTWLPADRMSWQQPQESPSTAAELCDWFEISKCSLDAVGQLPEGTGPQSAVAQTVSLSPDAGAGLSLTRQVSDRVERGMAELQSRMPTPSSPRRIHSGTGEVYTVVDHGSGDKAIFKPAAQPGQSRRRQLRDGSSFGSSSETRFSDEPSSGSSSTAGSSHGSSGPATPKQDLAAGVGGGEDEASEEERQVEQQAHNKEVAAYRLDHWGMAGVLPTMAVCVELGGKPEAGMIQQYLEHKETADEDEWGRRQIMRLRVREVHLVGALDVRLFNEDRHGGNLLLDQSSVQPGEPPRLVPIDHELTLPPWHDLERAQFCWLTWKQASEPFDAKTKEYIGGLKLQRDEAVLRSLALPEASLGTYRICFSFLKLCVSRGLTLRDIGERMVRDPALCPHDQPCEWPCQPSALERLVARAAPAPQAGDAFPDHALGQDDAFPDHALDRFLAELNSDLDACGCPAAPVVASLGSP